MGKFVIALFIPSLLIYRAFFLSGPLAWGDAPFFPAESLKSLVNELPAWTNRGQNFGGPLAYLWLYPLMVLYGLVNNNDAAILTLFYFPAVIFSFIASWIFAKKLNLSPIGRFFTSVVYGLNTYLILLVDGGQVGVALAYSLFPLAIGRGFWSLFLLSLADARLAVIALLTNFILTPRKIPRLFIWTLMLVALHSFWWFPLTHIGSALPKENSVSRLQLVSLINPLLLFQPHWPQNQFGAISPPPFYFTFVPFLIFGCLWWTKDKAIWRLALAFLILAFLVKGETPPFGFFYTWLVDKLPGGFAFRDSTKFFAPLMLIAGVLIGYTTQMLPKKFIFPIYIYFLLLLGPALLGNLNGVLGRHETSTVREVNQFLSNSPGSFRSLWFTDSHPGAYKTEDKPSLDASRLVDSRPFAALNVGTYDRFNFLHQPQSVDWFRVLGIRYLVFSGNPRLSKLNREQEQNWHQLLSLVATTSGLEHLSVSSLPVYAISNPLPRVFSVPKATFVIGGDDISSPSAQPAIYLEDGKFDPKLLLDVSSPSAQLLFNRKDKTDLQFVWLQKYFQDKPIKSSWASGLAQDYLDWKYQLLIRGIKFRDFTYNRKINYSSQSGEELHFVLTAPLAGEYYLAVRSLGIDHPLTVSFLDNKYVIQSKPDFNWSVFGPLSLSSQKSNLSLSNPGGLKAVNVVALVPKTSWEEAQSFSRRLLETFPQVDTLSPLVWQTVNYRRVSFTSYNLQLPASSNWIVFTDNYHPRWQILTSNDQRTALPIYSFVNGFYTAGWEGREIKLFFTGQDDVRWGIYFSVISLLLLTIYALYRL